MKPSVFLSHSSRDADAVAMFRDQAAALGIDVYLAEHDVHAGDSLADKVRNAIRISDAVVVLLTQLGAASAYVQQEIGVALESKTPVIPIVEVGVSGLAMLSGSEYVPFDRSRPEVAIRHLTQVLTRLAETVRERESARQRREQLEMLALLALLVLVVVKLSGDS